MDMKLLLGKRSVRISYLIFSIISLTISSTWFYAELIHSKSPVELYGLWKWSISEPDSAIVDIAKVYIPKRSIILKSEAENNTAEIEFIYDFKYKIGCWLWPDYDNDIFESAFCDLIEKLSFGDLTGRSFEFKFGNDDVYLLYELADFNTEYGNAYMVNIFLPDKKLVLLMTGYDIDVMESIKIIKKVVYNNERIDFKLVGEIKKEDNL